MPSPKKGKHSEDDFTLTHPSHLLQPMLKSISTGSILASRSQHCLGGGGGVGEGWTVRCFVPLMHFCIGKCQSVPRLLAMIVAFTAVTLALFRSPEVMCIVAEPPGLNHARSGANVCSVFDWFQNKGGELFPKPRRSCGTCADCEHAACYVSTPLYSEAVRTTAAGLLFHNFNAQVAVYTRYVCTKGETYCENERYSFSKRQKRCGENFVSWLK